MFYHMPGTQVPPTKSDLAPQAQHTMAVALVQEALFNFDTVWSLT